MKETAAIAPLSPARIDGPRPRSTLTPHPDPAKPERPSTSEDLHPRGDYMCISGGNEDDVITEIGDKITIAVRGLIEALALLRQAPNAIPAPIKAAEPVPKPKPKPKLKPKAEYAFDRFVEFVSKPRERLVEAE